MKEFEISGFCRDWWVKYLLVSSLGILFGTALFSQTTIQGKITDKEGDPVSFVNIFIENTLDGTTSDEKGNYILKTNEEGDYTIVFSSIGYDTRKQSIHLEGKALTINVVMIASQLSIDEVVVTAGAFEANNDREVALLRPLDIYTNAGAAGDIVGAIQTLPGVQKVGEQTGLFVRGGDASESKVVIDGMVVQNPFYSNTPGVSQRSRFSPFQFKGISFSSGGYSARYGEALSSILELNTTDLPDESSVTLGANVSGASLSGTKRWESVGLETTGFYTNLTPFYNIAETNYSYNKIPEGGGGSARIIARPDKNSLVKTMVNYSGYSSGTRVPDPDDASQKLNFNIDNRNLYMNTSYRYMKDRMYFLSGVSYSLNKDQIKWNELPAGNKEQRAQWRGEFWFKLTDRINFLTGTEIQGFNIQSDFDTIHQAFDEYQTAAYVEAEWKPAAFFALKPGLRYQYNRFLQESTISPRLAFALKISKYGQFSFAGGIYYQNPDNKYLLYDYKPGMQKAVHYITNYQWIKNERSLRIEAYYKDYDALIREKADYNPNQYRNLYGIDIDNSGYGYAQGIDFFWRDKSVMPNFDYWISYSYIDTRRLYSNFPGKATPDFVSDHTLNIMTKYFIEAWGLNISASYAYATGRRYFNPDEEFLSSTAPDYNDLTLGLSHIHSFGRWFTVFYLSFDNVFNRKNILGFRYSEDGLTRYEVRPSLDQWIFFGASISLTKFNLDEL